MDSTLPRRLLTGMRLDELTALLESRERALKVLRWLWSPAREGGPGVSAKARAALTSACDLPNPERVRESRGEDGTTKYVLRFGEATVETVLIPTARRSTVCVSSQAGCTRACAFCATATLGFQRNLEAGEMVAQYLLARAAAPQGAPARNVVFMGMGEPMDNLEEVLLAVELLTQAPAPQLAAQHITVSTSGVLPGMRRFLRECRASLALSVNGSSSPQRAQWMPQTRTWPLEALLDELREDRARSPRRVHFIEYVLFDGLNDAEEDAVRLVEQLRGVAARVNLIPHNPFEGSPLRPPPDERSFAFQRRVMEEGVPCFIRWSRGRDVAAACGQLALQGEEGLLKRAGRSPRRPPASAG